MSAEENEDPRFNFIKFNTMKLLDIDENLWGELIWKEESSAIIKDFLDSAPAGLLLIYFDHNEKLSLSLEMPSHKQIPEIIVYFTKNNISVSTENYKTEIMCGNICKFPLHQYQMLFENVLYPIFSSSSNNNRWPREISEDIIMHFQDFQKTLTYHLGIADGRTVLVISETAKLIENVNIEEISSENIDWELRNILNSVTDMLCSWIPIVREILDMKSEDILMKVEQGPATEIQFWDDRKRNLQFIQKQLNDPLIEKMIWALKKSKNCHFEMFQTLLQDVAEALDEAAEISSSLSTMSDQLQKLETCEFSKMIEDIPTAMNMITSSWTNSKYFNKVPTRIVVLIKKMCFFLIQKMKRFLNPSELFKSDQSEMKEKVKACIETGNAFLKSYSEFQENKTYPWVFPDKRVFHSFENFLGRLNNIYDMFEVSELYDSITKYKILGLQQAPFKIRLDELSATFGDYYKIFVESTYDPLDLKSNAFIEDYKVFSLRVDELDNKLGTALAQACMACVTPEDSFKLMNLIQDLLKRPLVNMEFKKIITSLLNNICMELEAAREIYDNLYMKLESGNLLIYKNLPPVSGTLQCSLDLQKKLAFSMEALQKIKHRYIKADDADLIFKSYKEMDDLLSRFQNEIFDKWKVVFEAVKEHLEKPLFIIDEEQDILMLNFTPEIIDVCQEIRYVKMIKKDKLLSSEALQMEKTLTEVVHAYSLLACTCRWYEYLHKNMMELEMSLVKDEWEEIGTYFAKGISDTWVNTGLQDYCESVYSTTKSLFERINEAKNNVQEVQLFINSWNKEPAFVRDHPDLVVKFEMFMTSKMHEKVYYAMATSTNMSRVVEANMMLFQCNPESEECKKYVEFLESIIENGLTDSIKCSLNYLVTNTDSGNKKLAPFYKVTMVLKKDIDFVPSLDKNELGSLYRLFEAVIENIYRPSTEIRRMTDIDKDYYESINENSALIDLKNKIFQKVEAGTNKILSQLVHYQKYADLWLQDIDTVLEDFILYGPLPDTKTDEDAVHLVVPHEIKPPTEDEFRAQILQFDMLHKKVENIPSETQVESWLLLDISSFKESVLSLIRNWSTVYKKKLVELKSQDKLRKLEDDADA